MAGKQPDEMYGKITEEGLQRMRNRLGILIPHDMPFNTVAHEDTIRHLCFANGDDNPLWQNPGYAGKSRWGGIIAPPAYLTTLGGTRCGPIPREVREKGAGALQGVPEYFSGSSWEWYRPIRPGDAVHRRHYLSDLEVRPSEFGGQSVATHYTHEYINQRDEAVGVYKMYFFRIEREASEKGGKHKDVPEPQYDDDYLAEIDRTYAAEAMRGAEPRYWEDVAEGEELPRMVRGPLTINDIVCWKMGGIVGNMATGPTRLAYKERSKHPVFFTKNEYGAWDPAVRVHWDHARARKVGNPRPYDFGRMRTYWLINMVTNWMGDDAWLFRFSDQTRRFNFVGDTSWLHGKVARKYEDDLGAMVDLELWVENQRGEVTTPGKATVILPSRQRGTVVLPAETGRFQPSVLKTPYSVAVPGAPEL